MRDFHLRGSLSTREGEIDLGVAGGKITAGVDILKEVDAISFSLNYQYTNSATNAIQLETRSAGEMEYLFLQQGIAYTQWYKEQVSSKFRALLTAAGNESDQLDYLYENLPAFVTISDEEKWKHLQILAGDAVDRIGTDEEKAVSRLVGRMSPQFLANRVNSNSQFSCSSTTGWERTAWSALLLR